MSFRHWMAATAIGFGGEQDDLELMQSVYNLGEWMLKRRGDARAWYILSIMAWYSNDRISRITRHEISRETGFCWRDIDGKIRSLVRLGHLKPTGAPETYRIMPPR